MELINKTALLAKIERLYNRAERRVTLEKEGLKAEDTRKYEDGLADAYDIVLSFIDTLEVKEVDEKSTKHFPHWKPTQEQMSDLYHAATMNSISCPSLESLYNDLKVIAQKGGIICLDY